MNLPRKVRAHVHGERKSAKGRGGGGGSAVALPGVRGVELLAAGAARPGAQESHYQEVAETQVPPPLPDPQEQAARAHPVTTVDI